MKFMDTKGMDKANYNNLLLVDSLNLGFRFKHMGKRDFASDYVKTVQSFARSYEASRIIITGDWGSTWRTDIYPEYKGNRKEGRELQSNEEKEEWKAFFSEMDKTLNLLQMQYTVLKYEGVEADDIIAYISTTAVNDYNHIWIISSDKDLDLLVNNKVSRFSFLTRKETTLENFESHYGYPQSWHIGIKVLLGDSGDNVPGVAGVGIKRAYSLLNQFDGDILDLMDALPLDGKYVYIHNLNTFGHENIVRNLELMDLLTYCEDAIGLNNLEDINEQL